MGSLTSAIYSNSSPEPIRDPFQEALLEVNSTPFLQPQVEPEKPEKSVGEPLPHEDPAYEKYHQDAYNMELERAGSRLAAMEDENYSEVGDYLPESQKYGQAFSLGGLQGNLDDAESLGRRQTYLDSWTDGIIGAIQEKHFFDAESGVGFNADVESKFGYSDEYLRQSSLAYYDNNANWAEKIAVGLVPGFISDAPIDVALAVGTFGMGNVFKGLASAASKANKANAAKKLVSAANAMNKANMAFRGAIGYKSLGKIKGTVAQALTEGVANGVVGLTSAATQDALGVDIRDGFYTERMVGDAIAGTALWGVFRTVSGALGSDVMQKALVKAGMSEEGAIRLTEMFKPENEQERILQFDEDTGDINVLVDGKKINIKKVNDRVAASEVVDFNYEAKEAVDGSKSVLSGPVTNKWKESPYLSSIVYALNKNSNTNVIFVEGGTKTIVGSDGIKRIPNKGLYDPNTDTLIINYSFPEDKLAITLGHEAVHSIIAKLPANEKEFVLNKMKEILYDGQVDPNLLSQKYKKYRGERNITEEFISDYIGSGDVVKERINSLFKAINKQGDAKANRAPFIIRELNKFRKDIVSILGKNDLTKTEIDDVLSDLDKSLGSLLGFDEGEFSKRFDSGDIEFNPDLDRYKGNKSYTVKESIKESAGGGAPKGPEGVAFVSPSKPRSMDVTESEVGSVGQKADTTLTDMEVDRLNKFSDDPDYEPSIDMSDRPDYATMSLDEIISDLRQRHRINQDNDKAVARAAYRLKKASRKKGGTAMSYDQVLAFVRQQRRRVPLDEQIKNVTEAYNKRDSDLENFENVIDESFSFDRDLIEDRRFAEDAPQTRDTSQADLEATKKLAVEDYDSTISKLIGERADYLSDEEIRMLENLLKTEDQIDAFIRYVNESMNGLGYDEGAGRYGEVSIDEIDSKRPGEDVIEGGRSDLAPVGPSLQNVDRFLYAIKHAIDKNREAKYMDDALKDDLKLLAGRLYGYLQEIDYDSPNYRSDGRPILSSTQRVNQPGDMSPDIDTREGDKFITMPQSADEGTVPMRESVGEESKGLQDIFNFIKDDVSSRIRNIFTESSSLRGIFEEGGEDSKKTMSQMFREVGSEAVNTLSRLYKGDDGNIYFNYNDSAAYGSISKEDIEALNSAGDIDFSGIDLKTETTSVSDEHINFVESLYNIEVGKSSVDTGKGLTRKAVKPKPIEINHVEYDGNGGVSGDPALFNIEDAKSLMNVIVNAAKESVQKINLDSNGVKTNVGDVLSESYVDSLKSGVMSELLMNSNSIHVTPDVIKGHNAVKADVKSKGGKLPSNLGGAAKKIYQALFPSRNLLSSLALVTKDNLGKYFELMYDGARMAADADKSVSRFHYGKLRDLTRKALSDKGVTFDQWVLKNIRDAGGGAVAGIKKALDRKGIKEKQYTLLKGLTEIEAQTMYARMQSALDSYMKDLGVHQLNMMNNNLFVLPSSLDKVAPDYVRLKGFTEFAKAYQLAGGNIDDIPFPDLSADAIRVLNLFKELKETSDSADIPTDLMIGIIRDMNALNDKAVNIFGSKNENLETIIPIVRQPQGKTGEYDISDAAVDNRYKRIEYGATSEDHHNVGYPIMINPLLTLVTRSIMESSHTASHAPFLRNAMSVHNNNENLDMFRSIAGNSYNTEMDKHLKLLMYPERGKIDFGEHGDFFKAIYNSSTIGILGANVKIGLNQIWSSAMLADSYGKEIYLKNAGRNAIPSHRKKTEKIIMEHGGGQYQDRVGEDITAGRVDVADYVQSRDVSNNITDFDKVKGQSVSTAAMSIIRGLDKTVVLDNWDMAMDWVSKQFGLTAKDGEAYWSQVRRKAQYELDYGQPTNSDYMKTAYHRSRSPVTRLTLGRFTTASQKVGNMVLSAIDKAYMYKDFKPLKKALVTLSVMSAGLASTDVLYGLAVDSGQNTGESLRSAQRRKETLSKDFMIKFMERLTGINPITGLAGRAISASLGSDTYNSTTPYGDASFAFKSLLGGIYKYVTAEEGDADIDTVLKPALKSAKALGLPLDSIIKSYQAVLGGLGGFKSE